MTRGTRIVAVESSEPEGELVRETIETEAQNAPVTDDWWEEAPSRPARPWLAIIAGTLTVLAVSGWSLLFFLANQAAMLAGGSGDTSDSEYTTGPRNTPLEGMAADTDSSMDGRPFR